MLNFWIYFALFILATLGFRMLFEKNFLKKILGLGLLTHVTNLVLVLSGETPPQDFLIGEAAFVAETPFEHILDPLPQALVLTAIVIGFALTCFLCLFYLAAEKDDS